MKIEFYAPEGENIPTKLRLKVDDKIDVYYNRLPNGLAYRFSFFRFQSVDCFLADKIVSQIVQMMHEQSYDHGAYWEEIVREVAADEHEIRVTVDFRVRDAG